MVVKAIKAFAIGLEGPRQTTNVIIRLDKGYGLASAGKIIGRGKAGKPAPNDGYVG